MTQTISPFPYKPVYPFFIGNPWPWRTRVNAQTVLDPNSANICANLRSKLTWPGFAQVPGTPVYFVGPNQPMLPVTITPDNYGPYIHNVPIPAGAIPSTGQDHYLTVVQQTPSTQNHRLWELWVAHQNTTTGAWTAKGGIERMHILTDNPGYSRVVKDPAGTILEQAWYGVAASRLALCGGQVQLAEMQQGYIGHALQLNIPWARKGTWSFPAQSCDGTDTATYSIPEGAWFRIDPTVNLSQLPFQSAMMMMFAQAVQDFGMIVTDQTGSGIGVVIEIIGSNPPGDQDGGPPENGVPMYQQYFPWEHIQLLPMDLRTDQDNTVYIEADDTDT